MPNELKISWKKLENLSNQFSEKLPKDRFDYILCISSGGLVFGKLVSDYLNLPLGVIAASAYRKGERKPRDNEVIIGNTATIKPLGERILLLDDLVDTGLTMKAVYDHLFEKDEVKVLQTGVLYKKPKTIFQPAYWVKETSKWIIFPYEKHEFLRAKNQ
jgi:hypothetical protein